MKSRRHQTADMRRRKLLGVLASGERYSGEQLARQLRVTRSAVWKLIRNLRDLGIEVDALAHQGYQLPRSVQLYNSDVIHDSLSISARAHISAIEVLLTVDSTNKYLADYAESAPGSGVACVAEIQTAGRGRRGRSWVAPFGSGVCLSFAWQFSESPPTFSALSLAVGVAVVRALRRLGGEQLQLKWPNDVVHRQRKLAGILIEMRGEATGPARVIVGIGLNVHMPGEVRLALAEQQATLVTDLHEVTHGNAPERNVLVGAILSELVSALQVFEKEGFAPFESEWREYDALRAAPVRVLSAKESIVGISSGVAADGALLVEVNGQLQRFMSGDVSLRPATGKEIP